MYTPNLGAFKYKKQILTKLTGEIDSNRVKMGNFKTLFDTINRETREKTGYELRSIIEPLGLKAVPFLIF